MCTAGNSKENLHLGGAKIRTVVVLFKTFELKKLEALLLNLTQGVFLRFQGLLETETPDTDNISCLITPDQTQY